jgi:hypothetical protein
VKFKTGFFLGVAAGAWAANKASGLQRGGAGGAQKLWARSAGASSEEAADKLRALTDLARERLAEVMDGPIGNLARERLTDLIGTSLGGPPRGESSSTNGVNGSIDTTARWPR